MLLSTKYNKWNKRVPECKQNTGVYNPVRVANSWKYDDTFDSWLANFWGKKWVETPILALSGRITRVLIMCLFHFIKARFVLSL